MIKNANGTFTIDGEDAHKVHDMKVGQLVDIVTITNVSSARFTKHKFYWAKLGQLSKNIPEDKVKLFFENLLSILSKFDTINTDTLHLACKARAGVDSISFDRLNDAKALPALKTMCDVIDKMETFFYGESVK